jgi:hypothetical protein
MACYIGGIERSTDFGSSPVFHQMQGPTRVSNNLLAGTVRRRPRDSPCGVARIIQHVRNMIANVGLDFSTNGITNL